MKYISKKTRGISDEFAMKIHQNHSLQSIYHKGNNDVIWAIRNNYVNLYYNCDSIAKISSSLKCEINNFYLTGEQNQKYISKTPQETFMLLDKIKQYSDRRATNEKKAQQKLFTLNNKNEKSNWFCIDIEYVKSYKNQTEKNKAQFSPRFDIIAISKSRPFKIAIIELKYGKKAYTGVSGIRKHIIDFDKLKNGGFYNDYFKQEIIQIISGLESLGVKTPASYNNICVADFTDDPAFYFITLDNNADKINASTPRQTCAGYLFNSYKWACKRISKNNIEQEYGDITDSKNSRLYVKFLFSEQKLNNLTINDIIDGQYDEVDIFK